MPKVTCTTCLQSFTPHVSRGVGNRGGFYCSFSCRNHPAPVVYCFTAGDGRRYIGSTANISARTQFDVRRTNRHLLKAFATYPSDTWVFAILEKLQPGCTLNELRSTEQKYIELFKTHDPKHGFNVLRARRKIRR